MLSLRLCSRPRRRLQKKAAYSTVSIFRPVPVLQDSSLPTFRRDAFEAALPAILPRGHFRTLPAVSKWFTTPSGSQKHNGLNVEYLKSFEAAVVPLEITSNGSFAQVHETLGFFLEAAARSSAARIYLAQASLSDLPNGMREDVPIPDTVLNAGKGDVYDTSIWLGAAPTFTPLHRDPNPNLFVQLAGTKMVRMFKPDVGHAIFAHVQQTIGGQGNALMRGMEMMEGKEKEALENMVWTDSHNAPFHKDGFECQVDPGDGLFIPKGWWHSIRGIGQGMTGSVNWWFR